VQERADFDDAAPRDLLVFDGRKFATADAFTEAFDDWCTRREAWEAEHEGVVLPEGVELGECPADPVVPHGGGWSRAGPQ